MATLQAQLEALARRLGQQCKALAARSLPAGGVAGAVLTKSSAADYAVTWTRRTRTFAFPCRGLPNAGELLGPYTADVPFTLLSGLANCVAPAGKAFTTVAVFTLLRNGTSIGTVAYAAGAKLPTFATSTAGDVAVAIGDVFDLQCPASQDATGADICFTFQGLL